MKEFLLLSNSVTGSIRLEIDRSPEKFESENAALGSRDTRFATRSGIKGSEDIPCTGTKTCSRCNRTLHVLHFDAQKKNKDCLSEICRECRREYQYHRKHKVLISPIFP